MQNGTVGRDCSRIVGCSDEDRIVVFDDGRRRTPAPLVGRSDVAGSLAGPGDKRSTIVEFCDAISASAARVTFDDGARVSPWNLFGLSGLVLLWSALQLH